MATEAEWILLVPQEAAAFIEQGGSWGTLTCRLSTPDLAAKVIAISDGSAFPLRLHEDPAHFLVHADSRPTGSWYRAGPDVATWSFLATRQQQEIRLEAFKEAIPELRDPGVNTWYIALTFTEDPPEITPGRMLPRFAAWYVSRDGVRPLHCDVEPTRVGLDIIADHWPVEQLQESRVLLIGLGSIGGATAEALGGYGLGHLDLVDPDRLLSHNIPRHVGSESAVGKYKVHAVAERLERFWPQTETRAFQADAIEDADLLRTLIDEADLVICTVDGVEPRRVISYLCKRAKKPLVLACVLANGRYAELLRMRPYAEVGCLECQRRWLVENGQIDLETTLDRGYGEGTRQNPMTAVGSDLHLTGALAAKAGIATVLSSTGHIDQVLENDNLVVALRPEAGLAAPFNSARALSETWYPAAMPYSDCPTCNRS